jgi:hypothetical protein
MKTTKLISDIYIYIYITVTIAVMLLMPFPCYPGNINIETTGNYHPVPVIACPPTLSVTTSHVDESCPDNDAELTISISGGCSPYTIDILRCGDNWHYHHVTNNTSLQLTDLDSREYHIRVTDDCFSAVSIVETIDDDAVWPLNAWTSGKAFGVDVKTNSEGNVIATGFWQDSLQLIPPYSQCFQTGYSNNIYLVQLTECGRLLWEQQIGSQDDADLHVNAISIDGEDDILMCGEYAGGTIEFYNSGGNLTLTCAPNTSDRDAFVAKFSGSNGECLWAARVAGSGEDNAKGVAADQNGYVFLTGDFDGPDIDYYDGGNNYIGTLSNGGNIGRDCFLIAYDTDGHLLEVLSVSSTDDDIVGDIACNLSYLSTGNTDVVITGSLDDVFMCFYYIFDITNETFGGSPYTKFLMPNNANNTGVFGRAVDITYETVMHVPNLFVTGWINDGINLSHPFVVQDVLVSPMIPYQMFQAGYGLVSSPAQVWFNKATDVCVNIGNMDSYWLGYFNEQGLHPILGGFTVPSNTNPQIDDNFYIDKFDFYYGLNSVIWAAWSNYQSPIYYLDPEDPEAFSMCFGQSGKGFFTGSYHSNLRMYHDPTNGVNPPVLDMNINAPNGSDITCYISRLVDNCGDPSVKRTPFTPEDPLAKSLQQQVQVRLIPNPAKDFAELILNFDPDQNSTFEIFTFDGRLVERLSFNKSLTNTYRIPLRLLKPGSYILRINSSTWVKNLRFVKI